MSQWWYSGSAKDKEKRKQEVKSCNKYPWREDNNFLQIKRMFALADKDKDGKLSVEEWREMLIQIGAPADE